MGKRGPAKTPTELAVLRGETRPSRVNLDAPSPPPTRAEAPEYLDLDALGVWHRLAPTLEARGLLTVWDVDAFAAYCTAVVHHRRAVRLVNTAGIVVGRTASTQHKHPALQVVRDQAALIVTLGGRFGLNPSDRAGLRNPDENPDDGGNILD
jgi:P27 family predicted phage terminase small subunit